MEKLIKQVNKEIKDKKTKRGLNLRNFKSTIIGIVIIATLGILAFFFKGGTEVRVTTGVTTKEVANTVTEIVKPIYQQQRKIEKQAEETQKTLNALNKNIEELNKTLKDLKDQKTTTKTVSNIMPSEVIQADTTEEQSILAQQPLFSHIEVEEELNKLNNNLSTNIYTQTVKTVKKKKKEPTVYIPAGSIVEGKLLYGFVAPESGMFPPVLLEFTKPIRTANDFFIPAQKCLITTSAQYDISQGLAILGGLKSTLSCVLKNGKVVEIPVNVAVGEEIKGKTVQIGLSGKEIWLSGKDFATITSMVSLSGMASSYQQGLVQQNVTTQGNVITAIQDRGLYSVLGGVNAGVNKFVEFWMKKYDKKVPAIKVEPKRRVFIVFVNGADLQISPKEL